jgi:riboflavin kinase
MATSASAVGHAEVAALKTVALNGGFAEPVKVSCSVLGDRLDTSSQTASRRLQRLEESGLIEREVVSDGQWVSITDDGEHRLRAEYADYRRIFEGGAGISLRGSVTSGMGEGRHYISLPGYMEQFVERLEYEPFHGTLNIDLTDESLRARAGLDSIGGVPIDGWEGEERTYGPATCYRATVETEAGDTFDPCHVIVPERTHHDERQLEVIAPEKLREELSLADDDLVTIRIVEVDEYHADGGADTADAVENAADAVENAADAVEETAADDTGSDPV